MKLRTVCPYCAYSFGHDFDDLDGIDNPAEEDVDCPKCGKTYHCTLTITVDVDEEEYEDESPEGRKGG